MTHDQDTLDFIKSAEDASKEVETVREELTSKMTNVFKKNIGFVFTKFPFIHRIVWRQYTPSFCDGDPCHFTSSHDCASLNGSGYEDHWDDEESEDYDGHDTSLVPEDDKDKAVDAVHQFMRHFDDEDMENMFGNGIQVEVKRGKISVDSYEGD